MAKSRLKLVAPTEVNRTVTPTRRPNAELRTREHLMPGEVEALIEAAKANRHGHRDATMILLAFRQAIIPDLTYRTIRRILFSDRLAQVRHERTLQVGRQLDATGWRGTVYFSINQHLNLPIG
jgi:hypothetical protein